MSKNDLSDVPLETLVEALHALAQGREAIFDPRERAAARAAGRGDWTWLSPEGDPARPVEVPEADHRDAAAVPLHLTGRRRG